MTWFLVFVAGCLFSLTIVFTGPEGFTFEYSAPNPTEIAEPNPVATISPYCDHPLGDPDSLHSSLITIEAFTHEIQAKPRPLSSAQCLAVTAYAKVQDWFGVVCEERDAKAAATWMRECLKNDWGTQGWHDNGCQLLGYKEIMGYGSSARMREYLRSNLDECEWSRERIRMITPELIENAARILRQTL